MLGAPRRRLALNHSIFEKMRVIEAARSEKRE